MRKICRNCKYAVVRKKVNDYAPNVVCMKRSNFEKGKVYLTQEDANCRNHFTPISGFVYKQEMEEKSHDIT